MSRHRTTAKMHRVRDQPEAPRTVEEADGGQSNPPAEEAVDEPAAEPASSQATLSQEALEQRLAAEMAAREVSEQRTTDLLARYFKVTLVMVGLNMLLAGASVATLIKFASRTQTVVVTQPPLSPPPAPARPPAAPAAPAVVQAVSPPVPAAPAEAARPAPPPPAKVPLLGAPPRVAAKPATLSSPARSAPARSARASIMPAPRTPATFAQKAIEEDDSGPTHTERW
jgi:hypothetical protein